MSRRMLFTAPIWVFVLYLAGATPATTQGTPHWGSPVKGCKVGIVDPTPPVVKGENLDIDITIVNEGDVDILCAKDRGSQGVTVRVSAVRNEHKVLKPEPTTVPTAGSEILAEIPKGRNLEWNLRLNDYIDLTRTGKYRVKIAFDFWHDTKPGAAVETASKEFIVTITDPMK